MPRSPVPENFTSFEMIVGGPATEKTI